MEPQRTDRIVVCLMVPGGTWDLAPIVDAVRAFHPTWDIRAVWCGDPHRRPRAAAGTSWADLGLTEPTGVGWSRLMVGMPGRAYEWARTAAAVASLFEPDEADAVIVLRVGSVGVLGSLTALVATSAMVLASRVDEELPADGLAPSEHDMIRQGRFSPSVACFRLDGLPALRWLTDQLIDSKTDDEIGHWLERAHRLARGTEVARGAVVVAGWQRWPGDGSPFLVDVEAVGRATPWYIDFGSKPSRTRLSDEPELAAAIDAARRQAPGEAVPLVLPGAIAVDEPIRLLMSDAIRSWRRGEGELPPSPYGPDQSSFLEWLETPLPPWGPDIGQYWRRLRERRTDLQAAFPRSDSVDQAAFAAWVSTSWQLESRSCLIRPWGGVGRPHIVSEGHNRNGINVVGYLGFDSSLGDVGRRIVASLEAAHVPLGAIDYHRTGSPRSRQPTKTELTAHHDTSLVVVNADQFHFFVADHGDTLLHGRRTIAYWFWELEHIPAHMVDAIAHVDEIWAGTTFVAEAFAAVTDKPVRCVPIPVVEPAPSGAQRADLRLPDGRFVFLVTFDHYSVAERKNPYGAVEAFVRAFPTPAAGGPVLAIKTMHGRQRWQNHERLLLAASGRDDIVVIDAHLDRPDQMAMLRAADCLVSLHRSEGLGLHCAEAMWLGKPVIATRYSGNLDFMDDQCSVLIDAVMVPVEHGEGVYPKEARWADPDLDQAADWMRRLAADPALCRRLGDAARARMQAQPSLRDTGRAIARAAALGPYAPEPDFVSARRTDGSDERGTCS